MTPPSGEQPAFLQRLSDAAGAASVFVDEQVTTEHAVDGLTPAVVVSASSAEQISEVIKLGNEFGKSIVPRGSGTKQSSGPRLTGADVVISLKQLNKMVELDASNFSIQVEAGTVNADLQKKLAEEGLSLPFDPFCMETSTIGGELATNASGPLRAAYGTARDIFLGVTAVTPTGDIIRTGGKTMKNVAGIDLCKLLIGSWGTLGIITDAVIRVLPQAEASRSLLIAFSRAEDAFQVVSRLLVSKLTPVSVEMMDGATGRYLETAGGPSLGENDVLLMINVDGNREDVERHQKDIGVIAGEGGARRTVVLEDAKASKSKDVYRRTHQSLFAGPAVVRGKASVPLSNQGEMFRAIRETAAKQGLAAGVTVHGYNGILYARFDENEADPSAVISELKETAAGLGGFFIVDFAAPRFRENGTVLPPRDDYKIMRSLKEQFDPRNVLNPGKLVWGRV